MYVCIYIYIQLAVVPQQSPRKYIFLPDTRIMTHITVEYENDCENLI